MKIIARRNYKLADYGIKPIGFEDPVDVANKAMADENKTLKAQVADLNSKFEAFMKMQAQGGQNAKEDDASGGKPGGGTGTGTRRSRS